MNNVDPANILESMRLTWFGDGGIATQPRQMEALAEGDELRALVEAELLLAEHWSERHGCGCPRHRPWRVA